MKLKLRKLIAGTLAATMVIGSNMTVFATDISSNAATSGKQEGTGVAYDHVDTDVWAVTLPTEPADITTTYNFYVDPERLVDKAGVLADGSADGIAVKKNADGVYFLQKAADGSNPAVYGSTSMAFNIIGKNSAPIVVSATAQAKQNTENKDIAMVSKQEDFDSAAAKAFAAATPTLLLKLKVGTSEGIVPKVSDSKAVTVRCVIPGQPANFTLKPKTGALKQYAFAAKTEEGVAWKSVPVTLVGKTNYAQVSTTGHTAPKIELTWKAEKPAAPTTSSTLTAKTNGDVTFTMGDNATDVTSVAVQAAGTTTAVPLTEAPAGTTAVASGKEWIFNSETSKLSILGTKLTAGATVIITFDNSTTVSLLVPTA